MSLAHQMQHNFNRREVRHVRQLALAAVAALALAIGACGTRNNTAGSSHSTRTPPSGIVYIPGEKPKTIGGVQVSP